MKRVTRSATRRARRRREAAGEGYYDEGACVICFHSWNDNDVVSMFYFNFHLFVVVVVGGGGGDGGGCLNNCWSCNFSFFSHCISDTVLTAVWSYGM